MRAGLLLAVVSTLCCCFSPDYGQRPFTCPTGACPSGYVCSDGVCVTEGLRERPDAGIDRRIIEPDAPFLPPTPVVRIEETRNGSEALCQASEFAIGGGVSCADAAVQSSRATKDGGWTGGCVGGEIPAKVTAYCVPRIALNAFDAPVNIGSSSAVVYCRSDYVVAGGSCQCPTGQINSSLATEEGQGWRCDCDTGQAISAAHCLSVVASTVVGLIRSDEAITESDRSFAICPPETSAIGGGCGNIPVGFSQIGNCFDSICFECRPPSSVTIFCIHDEGPTLLPPD